MSTIFKRMYAFRAEKPSAIKKLVNPIGVAEKQTVSSNSGIDRRPLKERKADLLNLDKNRERREELKKEFSKSSFQGIYDFRDTGGKFFTSPAGAWPASASLYMPNFRGITLDKRETGTLEFLGGKTTIVRVFSSSISFKQISSYTQGLDFEQAGCNLFDVNTPTSWLNLKLVKWFRKSIKKSLLGPWHHYMICRVGVTHTLRSTIWAGNGLGGYLYVVDSQGKVRWAASGPATDAEKRTLNTVLNELKSEPKA